MMRLPDTKGERIWRWMRRIAGLAGFVLCGVLLVLEREIPVWFALLTAGCLGIESVDFRRRN